MTKAYISSEMASSYGSYYYYAFTLQAIRRSDSNCDLTLQSRFSLVYKMFIAHCKTIKFRTVLEADVNAINYMAPINKFTIICCCKIMMLTPTPTAGFFLVPLPSLKIILTQRMLPEFYLLLAVRQFVFLANSRPTEKTKRSKTFCNGQINNFSQ
jgi:hypothetical protein